MAHSDILSQPDRGLGLDRPQTEALLALFSRCDDLREFGREVIQSVVNALMDSQAQEACGAPRGSRSPERVNSRNGYRERSLSTSLGDLELRVPKLREGTYFPEGILERYTRVEASMVALVREMYVAGVSTRKVGLVAEELGVSSLSSSEVSALCAGLDEEAEAFRTRPIEGEHPYVWLDATYMKCRTGGRYASVALVTAIGMSSSGHKEFLGCACFDSESEAAWSEFLGSLRDRGLRGVRLAVSDAHAGLAAAVSRVLPGCSWQRCLTHLQRDIRGHVHSLAGQALAADLVRACAGQADADVARAAWDLAAPRVRALSRAAGDVFEGAREDALAREVRLAHAGAPHEQDVLGPLDEPQGRELLDLGARDRRLEVPVEVRQPLDVGEPRRPYALAGDPDLPGGDLDARHLLEGGGEAPLARGDHPHVVGQGRRHLVQPERGEVRLRPDRGATLRDGAHHAPPSESSSARLARAASAMSASARPRFPSRACP